MRDLISLIDEMIAEIPKKEKYLIESLKDIQESQLVRAPEDMLGWELVSEELRNMEMTPLSPMWKYKICSIFSTMPIEDIKKEVKEECRKNRIKKH